MSDREVVDRCVSSLDLVDTIVGRLCKHLSKYVERG